jgi:hypothetical protein
MGIIRSVKDRLFQGNNQAHLLSLHIQVDTIKRGKKTPEDFYRLGKAMESYRDHLADYLEGLPTAERSAVEDQLSPAVYALVEGVNKLADEAHKAGIIDEGLGSDVQMVGISLLAVCAFTKIVVEPRERVRPGGKRP